MVSIQSCDYCSVTVYVSNNSSKMKYEFQLEVQSELPLWSAALRCSVPSRNLYDVYIPHLESGIGGY